MSKRIIRICYRKIIDTSSIKPWDKLVFESSFKEFQVQAQLYNQEKKYSSFTELLLNVKGAERLHFLVSSSVIGYLKQLNGLVPDVVNNIGKHFLEFKNYNFEIINSGMNDKALHQVAISFFSEPLIWHETIGDLILISPVKTEETEYGKLSHLFRLQPFFTIYSLKEE